LYWYLVGDDNGLDDIINTPRRDDDETLGHMIYRVFGFVSKCLNKEQHSRHLTTRLVTL